MVVNIRKAVGRVSISDIIIRVRSICKILTRYYIARVHGVFVLDKAEAIHKLNLGNLARAMGVEVVLNIGLGSYNHKVRSAFP